MIQDEFSFILIIQKTVYLWFMDHSDEVYDLIDWTLDCILKERIKVSAIREYARDQEYHIKYIFQTLSPRTFKCHKTSLIINSGVFSFSMKLGAIIPDVKCGNVHVVLNLPKP